MIVLSTIHIRKGNVYAIELFCKTKVILTVMDYLLYWTSEVSKQAEQIKQKQAVSRNVSKDLTFL